jgi:ABC-type Zn uptake system ZnuABC Zn-binding protein ZnuA
MMKRNLPILFLAIAVLFAFPAMSEATLKVVTTVQDFAAIARYIGGRRVTVEAIVAGNSDAHFVKPKPSYAIMLRDADLFVSTGLDLELWAPVLVNKAGNRKIVDGAEGYVSASQGLDLMEKPASMDRSAGDVHVYGNPHITTSPLNIRVVARNIATGLCKVDPDGCDSYRLNLDDFDLHLSRRLYGDRLLELLGAETLDPLARNGRLVPFLEEQGMLDELGGWLGGALPLRGQKLVCYHKNWIYFTTLFGLTVIDYVEPKPGIPPTARHVAELVQRIDDEEVRVLLTANYFERRKPELIAERTGIVPVVVPMYVQGEPGVETYFDLVDLWVGRLKDAFGVSGGTAEHVHHEKEDHHDVHHRD